MAGSRGGMQQAGDLAKEWITAQRACLRAWIRANVWPTVAWMGIALLAALVLRKSGLPAWTDWLLSGIVFAAPVLVIVRWVRTVPRFWPEAASLAWLSLLILTALGQVWTATLAAQTLNALFQEAPGLFPVALLTATLLSLPAAVAFAGAIGVMILIFAHLVVDLLGGLLPARQWRTLPRRIGRAFLLSISLGLFLAPALVFAFKAPELIRLIALEADFHREFRCERNDWPHTIRTGVDRVAFLGDEQVLAYDSSTDRLIVLPCKRLEAAS